MPTVLNVHGAKVRFSWALPEVRKDPADRFIIATALLNDFTVATGGRRFAEYGVETIQ